MRNGFTTTVDAQNPIGTMRKITLSDEPKGLGTLTDQTRNVLVVVEGEVRMTYDGVTAPSNSTDTGIAFYDGSTLPMNVAAAVKAQFVARVTGEEPVLWVQDFSN